MTCSVQTAMWFRAMEGPEPLNVHKGVGIMTEVQGKHEDGMNTGST